MKSEWLSNWNGHKAWAAAIVLNEIGEGVEVKHASKKEIEAAEAAGVERRPCRYPSGEFMLASKGGAIAKIIEIPAWPMPSFAVFIGNEKRIRAVRFQNVKFVRGRWGEEARNEGEPIVIEIPNWNWKPACVEIGAEPEMRMAA